MHLLRKSTKSEGKGNLEQAIDINYPILKTLEFRITCKQIQMWPNQVEITFQFLWSYLMSKVNFKQQVMLKNLKISINNFIEKGTIGVLISWGYKIGNIVVLVVRCHL